METLYTVFVGILASIGFVFYPTAFLVGLSIWLLQQFFLYEDLFRTGMVQPTIPPANRLPSRTDFLRKCLRPLLALVYDDCLICRDQPTEPIQIPCKHIYCNACFTEWINRGHRRCPFCTKILFSSDASVADLERAIKLTIAAQVFGAPISTFRFLASGLKVGWWSMFLEAFAAVWQWSIVFNALMSRSQHGPSWWMHVFPKVFENAANDLEEADVFAFLCLLPVVFTLYEATTLNGVLPSDYLYQAFCVA